jgi:uncharacterized protein (TIGR02687 family)
MNLKYIQDKLNEMFTGNCRQLVMWYDDHAEFFEEINELGLDKAEIHILDEDNLLFTKFLLEIKNPDTNYLIYAPFSRPDDKHNYLADIAYYATPFYADKISIIAQELNIPDDLKPVLAEYPKFWNATSRVNSFKDLGIDKYSEEIIQIAILCVMANVKIVSFDELLKKVLIQEDLTKNKYIEEFRKMDILNTFWDFCHDKYGYHDENPTIEKFLISLLITYTSINFKANIPKAWKSLLSDKRNDIGVFINNLMSNINYREEYDHIASYIAKKIKVENQIKKIHVECYFDCDTFEIFDEKIIGHLSDLLKTNQEELLIIPELLAERQKKHFYDKYAYHYAVISWANQLIKYINEFSQEDHQAEVEEIIKLYCENWSWIDRSYREFYCAYDKIEDKSKLQDLRKLIENMYTNTYLSKLAMLWSDKLEKYTSINDLPLSKQDYFFKDNIRRSIRKHKTVFIISDAFRYECAEELKDELNLDPTRLTEIKAIISTVPSYTPLGMASLLPHKEIKFNEDYRIFVDEKPCSNTQERQKILETHVPDAIAMNYNELVSLNMANLRKRLKNKILVYVFHNQIDAIGDNPSTENEVLNATKDAIDEITKLITKLTNEASFKHYWITADHGFIYKRDKLKESDKVDVSQKGIKYKNKRFLLTKEDINIEGTSQYSLDYLMENLKVTVPRGVDIFKIQGAGQNYVHGGASLQEIVLPVLKIKSEAVSKNQDYVELTLVSLSKRITNLSTILTFVQKENISNKILPLEAKLYLEDEKGEKISNEVIIHANKNVESAKDREFKEKFTLRNKEYSKTSQYYLIIENMDNDVEIGRYEFIIDIAISDDFTF